MYLEYIWNWEVVTSRFPQFFAGAWIDLYVTVIGFSSALVIGLTVAILRVSGVRIATIPSYAFTQFVRGVPGYVLLLWIYFGLSQVIGLNLGPLQAIMLTLAIGGSGYTSEIFRGGIIAIDRGQREAATSLGMSRRATYRDVILPQAIRIIVPPLGNIFVGQLKGATIMSVIAAPDMVFVAQDLVYRYLAPFEAYAAVGVILVAMVSVFSGLVYLLERNLRIP